VGLKAIAKDERMLGSRLLAIFMNAQAVGLGLSPALLEIVSG